MIHSPLIHLPEQQRKNRLLRELGLKGAAAVMLADRRGVLTIPTEEEWIGLNLLERDGELDRELERLHGKRDAVAVG